MQKINKNRRDPKIVRAEEEEAKEHVRFCLRLYKIQIENRRYFVHEHPAGAASWQMAEMIKVAMMPGVDIVTMDMCCFGMTAEKDGIEGPVRKRTKIASNSKEVLKRIDRRCPNDIPGEVKHQHVVLESGRPKNAQVYPRAFCRAVCEGIAAEKRLRSLGLEAYSLGEILEFSEYGSDPNGDLHETGDEWMEAMDDQTGEALETKKVRRAREEEI